MLECPAVKSVGIVGLGYVGLPLATAFAEAGVSVVGVDTDPAKVTALNSGESYIEDVPSEVVHVGLLADKLRFSKEYAPLNEVGAVIICLPTPLNENREPDLSIVVGA